MNLLRKAEWIWNVTYQKIFNKTKSIIKEDECMKLYDDTKKLYIEADASGIWLEATLLQTRSDTSCPRDEEPWQQYSKTQCTKSLSSAEKRYSNTERETLGILYGLEKLNHYCFVWEMSIFTDHKPLVTIFREDVPTLSKTTMNSTQNTPIQSQDHIQTWTRSIHSRLAVQTKPQGKQWCRNTLYAAIY